MAGEFKDFLTQYKVLGLAVAFILGLYIGQVVQGLVNDLVMPIITLVTGGQATAICNGSTTPVPAWQCISAGPFLIGAFLGTVVTLVIVALVIFLIVKMAKRYKID